MIKVNAMGDACPIPVVKTKNAIRELQGAGSVETLVDNEIAVQNLTKMAVQKGFGVHSEKISENEYKVTMTVSAEAAQVAANSAVASVEEENCPDGYCEEQGKISGHTQTIVCLPHKLVVEVLENENDQSFGTSDPEDVAPDTIAK